MTYLKRLTNYTAHNTEPNNLINNQIQHFQTNIIFDTLKLYQQKVYKSTNNKLFHIVQIEPA